MATESRPPSGNGTGSRGAEVLRLGVFGGKWEMGNGEGHGGGKSNLNGVSLKLMLARDSDSS